MASSGLRIRSIGRRESESSPMRVKRPDWGARSPEIMRMVEPELPQSRGLAGGVTRPATPVISMESGRFTVAPSDSMQARVEAQSAPVEKLVKRDVPSAKPPSMA